VFSLRIKQIVWKYEKYEKSGNEQTSRWSSKERM
jgi:hypothetical protein